MSVRRSTGCPVLFGALVCARSKVNTEGLYKMMMQHHKEVMDQLDCHSAILSALSARKVSVVTNYHSPDSASSSGQGPPPKSRRASFTPLQFVTFEEEERNRQAAALANSNMASGSASMTQPDVGFFKRPGAESLDPFA